MTRETHHKATQRALQLLTLPVADACEPSARLQQFSSRQHQAGASSSYAAGAPSSADSNAGAGAEQAWAEVHALQRRLTEAQHPQVCHLPRALNFDAYKVANQMCVSTESVHRVKRCRAS